MSVASAAVGGREVVRIGELKFARDRGVLFTIGLGSCVCVALYDPTTRIGGMGHVMLPASSEARGEPAIGRFADTAVPALIDLLVSVGAVREPLTARIAGGSSMFASALTDGGRNLGERNVSAVRAALAREAVPLTGENVGGEHGRSVFLDTSDGTVLVRSVRLGDVIL
jgi:chemotaxis protein CheD